MFHISSIVEAIELFKIYFDKYRTITSRATAAILKTMPNLSENIRACTLCTERFAATQTAHSPRPVAWFTSAARVHKSGVPFDDPSGERLRSWLGLVLCSGIRVGKRRGNLLQCE